MVTREKLSNKGEESIEAEKKFDDLIEFIENRKKEGKMVNVGEISAVIDSIKSSITGVSGQERIIKKAKEAIARTRESNPVLAVFMLEIFEKAFNHKWSFDKGENDKEISEAKNNEERNEVAVEINSENLWRESMEYSRGMDRAFGRKLAKKIRKQIKIGVSPEELVSKFKEKLPEEESLALIKGYEKHYKIWRNYIEEEAEKIKLKLESYEILKEMWREGDISIEELVAISALSPAAEKFANSIFGDFQEKKAARKLLREIRKKNKQREKRNKYRIDNNGKKEVKLKNNKKKRKRTKKNRQKKKPIVDKIFNQK